jgi:Zn-dependent metalloprotease
MNRRWFYLWTVVFIAISSLLEGQTLHYNDAEKLVSGSKIVRLNEKNKTIQYIQLKDDVEFSEKSQSNWLKKALKLTASHELKEVSKSTDKKKFTHVKYQIYYKN